MSSNTLTGLAAFMATATLAACSSGSGGAATPSFADYRGASAALLTAGGALDFTDPMTLPTSGQVAYDGVLIVDATGPLPNGNETIAGDLRLTANFTNNRIAGSVTNLIDDDEEALAGQLTISQGAIDRTANVTVDDTYSATLGGRLTDLGGRTFDVSARMDGDFGGADYRFTGGVVDGTFSTAAGTGQIEGYFIARQ